MHCQLGALGHLGATGCLAAGATVTLTEGTSKWSLIVGQVEQPMTAQRTQRGYSALLRVLSRCTPDQGALAIRDFCRREPLYPPAMLLLATDMRIRGEYDAASDLLEALLTITQDAPEPLVEQSILSYYSHQHAVALGIMSRINCDQLQPKLRDRVTKLRENVVQALLDERIYHDHEQLRLQQDQREIDPNLRLRAALKRLPLEWLDAVTDRHGMPWFSRRPERERELAEWLSERNHLSEFIESLTPDLECVLRMIIASGGWCKLQKINRAFTDQEGDSYWWQEQAPESVVGRLRHCGLVWVGRTKISGRQHKVAVIPVELRPLLAEMLR